MHTNKLKVKKRNQRLENFNPDKVNKCVTRACNGLNSVSASEILLDAELQLYDKITTREIDDSLILSARSKIEKDPEYSKVASRLAVNSLYKEVFKESIDSDTFELQYKKTFVQNIKKLINSDRLTERLLEYDLKSLSDIIIPERDDLFNYLGVQILIDRYFLRVDDKILETPQAFWMRVAMGLALNEDKKEERAIEFYNLFSNMLYTPSTPTLFNSGGVHSQLSSCYLNTFDDSIDGIFEGVWQEARKSKFAGGLGFDVSNFRASGAFIKGTNGISGGIVPWLKIFNDTLVAVNQGGKRPGAGCAYLEPWHLDFEDFLNLRRNTGDERLRCHDMNTASWIPDLFMQRVQKDGDWYMFCPTDCRGLHETYGEEFNSLYKSLCLKAEDGQLKSFRKIKAKDLWKKMLKVLFETSHPWVTFKDPSNIRYSNQHVGVVHSSNLCTEIMLHTKPSTYNNGVKTGIGETAVCNLGSINLKNHIEYDSKDRPKLNKRLLSSSIRTAIRLLDNVIDLNFYPTKEAENANMQHRPVGLGMMATHDILQILDIQYDSDEAAVFVDGLTEFFSYNAIYASSLLAKERGSYKTYAGSLWDQGILPMDTYNSLMRYRKSKSRAKPSENIDWKLVREHITRYGMRNSNTMAIAPTATIGYINGVEQSIEPNFSVLFVYECKSGNFYITNEQFVSDMKKAGLWSAQLAEAVKDVDGDVMLLNIPQVYQEKYKTAFDRDMFKLINCNAARQKWIDQGISFNLYNKETSLKYLNDMYMAAWEAGLKTTYYLRNRGASKVEKSTQKSEYTEEEAIACSIASPESCEACQ
jgi:ribonucleoside-diphosphate reductase alpha chain